MVRSGGVGARPPPAVYLVYPKGGPDRRGREPVRTEEFDPEGARAEANAWGVDTENISTTEDSKK